MTETVLRSYETLADFAPDWVAVSGELIGDLLLRLCPAPALVPASASGGCNTRGIPASSGSTHSRPAIAGSTTRRGSGRRRNPFGKRQEGNGRSLLHLDFRKRSV